MADTTTTTTDTEAADLARQIAAAIAGEDTTVDSSIRTADASSLNTKSGSGC